MNVLVLNVGSSSVKFQMLDVDPAAAFHQPVRRWMKGLINHLSVHANVVIQRDDGPKHTTSENIPDAASGLRYLAGWIRAEPGLPAVEAVGHRIVHGGEYFQEAVVVDDPVLEAIDRCAELAPLHNPPALAGLYAARDSFPVAQVAVFDTAYHRSLEPRAFLYGLPYEYYERHRVRRYGFHGTSHRYLVSRYAERKGIAISEANLITLHLGNGCSAALIRHGKSADTSMGMTPLEGLMMGTRSGDIDAALVPFLCTHEHLPVSDVEHLLNFSSGLLGVSGVSNDMRELEDAAAAGNARAQLAVEMFCYRIRKYVGAYLAAADGAVDALIFAGGIGENSAGVRRRVAGGFEWAGMALDETRNRECNGQEASIGAGSKIDVLITPTDEEAMIARDTARCVASR